MFKENNGHNQQELFNSYSTLHPRTQNKLKKSWAVIFYEHVFSRIDEKPFAVFYSQDKGRGNFPVNILLSLELVKHIFDYSDENLLDQYSFNYQVMYALGERNLGERYMAARTLYNFRSRVYHHTIMHPDEEDLIFGQFKALTDHFLQLLGLDTRQQRMDSTFFMSNIKLAGRLTLAHDVLVQALKALPEQELPEQLQEVLKPEFKTNLLFKTRSAQVPGRLQELFDLSAALLEFTENQGYAASEIALLQRFLEEQTVLDPETNNRRSKENKDIAATSLQSAYDPDATFRNKNGRVNKGYLLNMAETCADENPIQLVTDYTTNNSSVSDTAMLMERLPKLKENTELEELYVDGGYYSEEVEDASKNHDVKVHYTDMTGKAPSAEKIPLSEFEIDGNFRVHSCPESHPALKSNFKKDIVNAHFSLEHCRSCPRQDTCPVKFQQKSAVLRVKKKSILAANARKDIFCKPLRREATSKRAASEGSISATKRSQGAAKLRVRTRPKVQVVMGFKMIGRNVRQLFRYFEGKIRKHPAVAAHAEKLAACISHAKVEPPPPRGVVCTFL